MKKITNIFLILMILSSAAAAQTTWKLDKAHSRAGFKVKHMVITNVKGQFDDFDMKLVQKNDGDFTGAEVELTIKTASINTANEGRDKHLRSSDFFLVEKYPEIIFRSTSVRKQSRDNYIVTGNLTMRGVTREIELNAELGGILEMDNMTVAGFHVTGIVNRKDFGIKYNKVLEMGGVAIGENVEIDIDLEFKKSDVD